MILWISPFVAVPRPFSAAKAKSKYPISILNYRHPCMRCDASSDDRATALPVIYICSHFEKLLLSSFGALCILAMLMRLDKSK